MPQPKPYKLITVNTAPDRASRMVRKLAEEVKDRYIIIHCVNASSMSKLAWLHKPDRKMKLTRYVPQR
jgi:hypothetical protein